MMKNLIVGALASVLIASASFATDWKVDYSKSEVRFGGTHAGNEFTGIFEKWQADINFDASNLSASKVKVTLDPATAKTGNGLYDGTLKGEDWFKVDTFKTAVFEAVTFAHTGGNAYTAEGTLQIRDKTLPLTLVFTLDTNGNIAEMNASHSIDRIAYDLGVQSDADAAWVSKNIELKIKVVASH